MIEEIQGLMNAYYAWLKDRSDVRKIDNKWIEITTPYLDRHNDYIQIYATKKDDGFILTDDGYTILDLKQGGCDLNTPKRQALLKMTLNGFGIKLHNNEIMIKATPDNFAMRKHNLIQAMLAVNDMFYLARPMVINLFYEEVVNWLDTNEIRYTSKVIFSGKSGYDHLFNFVIPKSLVQPERIIQTISSPNRNTAQAIAFSWLDTKEVRPHDSRAYAFLNDKEGLIPFEVISALSEYSIEPVRWSQRDEVREVLSL